MTDKKNKTKEEGFFKWIFKNPLFYTSSFAISFLIYLMPSDDVEITILSFLVGFIFFMILSGILLLVPFATYKSVIKVKDNKEFVVRGWIRWIVYCIGCLVCLDFVLFWIIHLIVRNKKERFFGVSFHNLIYSFGCFISILLFLFLFCFVLFVWGLL